MIDKKTYEELMSYLVKVECDRLKEEQTQQAQSASASGLDHRSNGMQGSASSKHTASGGKKPQKLAVSSFGAGNGVRDSAEKLTGKISKGGTNAASNTSTMHASASAEGAALKSASQPKPVRSTNAPAGSVKRINTTASSGVVAQHPVVL